MWSARPGERPPSAAANREGPKVPLAAGGEAAGDAGARESLAAAAASDRARAELSLATGRSPVTRLGRCEVLCGCGARRDSKGQSPAASPPAARGAKRLAAAADGAGVHESEALVSQSERFAF